MNEPDEEHYETPRFSAKPGTGSPKPIASPVPMARRKKVAATVEEHAQKASPSTYEAISYVSPSSPVQVPAPATTLFTSSAVQSVPESQAQPAAAPEDNFGSCLQSARDCINKRHDDELKALESFRVYMHKRAKADAEYAATLGKIGSQASRETGSLATGSNIVQVRRMSG